MRSYIFTESERGRLEAWLGEGVEDDTTRMVFVAMRRDFRGLLADVELMARVMRRLRGEGRWAGRSWVPRGLGARLRAASRASSGRV